MAQRWKPTQGVEYPTGNGLLCSPKWFAQYDFHIYKFLRGGNQQGVQNLIGNRQCFTLLT